METAGGLTVYTAEEMSQAVTDGQVRTLNSLKQTFADEILQLFRSEVEEGNLTREYATDLYNGIASAIGFDTVESISSKWTVEAVYNDEVIAEFTDIEADSEEEAIDKVSSDLSVEEVEMTITIEYDGRTETGSVSGDCYRVLEKITLNATEQE